jgi:hypothetical protein
MRLALLLVPLIGISPESAIRATHAGVRLQLVRAPPPLREEPPHLLRMPLFLEDGGLGRAQVVLWQDRLKLAAGEAAHLSVACEPPPCLLRSGPFREESGMLIARVVPVELGLTGNVDVEVHLSAGGEQGFARFFLEHTRDPPARFTGDARDDRLDVYIELEIARAGRYVVSASADDRNGVPLAIARGDAELTVGRGEVKLRFDGDGPISVRDVEGYRMTDEGDESLVAWKGHLFTTR